MKKLTSNGEYFLADLFFQSKPKIVKPLVKKKDPKIDKPEDFAYFKAQLLPSLILKHKKLSPLDQQKLVEFDSLV
jgi:hypothetical protein